MALSKITNESLSAGVQTAMDTDLAPVRSDILKLAIHSGIDGNRAAFNLDDSFIDTFEDDTGITTETTVDRDTAGEYCVPRVLGTADYTTDPYASGDRTSLITVTRSSSPELFHSSFLPSNNNMFVDDVTDSGNAYINSGAITGGWLKFDFGSGVVKLVTGLQWYLTASYSHDFRLDGSNDDSSWTTIGASIDIGTGAQLPAEKWTGLTHTTQYRYYRLYATGNGTGSGGQLREVQFKIPSNVVNATGTLISDPQTASTSRTSASGVIIYEDAVGTNTLGTDLKIYFSCDNSAWTEASSYGTATTYSGTKKLVKLGATTCTAGTSVAMKAEWANQSVGSQSQIAQGTGTAIGNAVSNGTLSSAFDGTTIQAASASAAILGSSGNDTIYIGKDWGLGNTKTITGFEVWSPNNDGISSSGASGASGCSLTLFGSNSNDISTAINLGGLSSLAFNLVSNEYSKLSGLTTSTAYRYHWIKGISNGHSGSLYIAEVEFFETPSPAKEARLHGWAVNY
jgi:hypothetical protein